MWRRRRTVLNEALHELRRPLQALALAGSAGTAAPTAIADSVRLAATALERLDREINGAAAGRVVESFPVAPVLAAAVARWQARAALAGSTLVLRGEETDAAAAVAGDRWAIAQALDNLVVNAIEHGGPRIVVAAAVGNGHLRISVRDCGRPLPLPGTRGGRAAALGARIRGRSRHGHGLRVVNRVAAEHGGRFALECTPGGAEALLELPAR